MVDHVLLCDIVECENLEIFDDPESTADELEVVIRTTEEGYNAGRSYIFKSERQDALDWVKAVDDAVDVAKRLWRKQKMQNDFGHSNVAMARAKCKLMLANVGVQKVIALIISLAFLVDMLEAQYLPARGSETEMFFFAFDSFVTFFFVIELSLNMFALSDAGLCHYFTKKSRCFDMLVVVVSVVSVATYLLNLTQLGYIKMLRLVRVFRVLRS